MRELRESKGLPGIALTGFGSEHDVSKARAAGFSEHLTKPINFERLEEAIQSLLDARADHQIVSFADLVAASNYPPLWPGRRSVLLPLGPLDASFNSRESFSTR